MRLKSILATLLLLVAGLQTAQAQGFRVYKSDGTVAQFSLRTDSIVFYDGIGTDQDFGPFTPVNQCITGTWYKTKSESVTFREDGTTDYMQGATYEFMPYQGSVIIYNASGEPMNILKVHKVTSEMLILSTLGDNKFNVYSRTQPVQLVTSITLNYTSLNLKLNETRSLVATVRPENADNKEVEWTSSDEAVAVVGKFAGDIIVMAKSSGICTITCAATDGSGVKAECQVTVDKPVTNITLSSTTLTLYPGFSHTLTATVSPSDAMNRSVSWSSNMASVATVDQSGEVTAKAKGTCTITCSAIDGSGVKAECQVQVKNDESGTINGREYVDLGLPSGTLWATCNVGASSPEEYGDYFAWGETKPKSDYSWKTYKWCNGSYNTMTKYCTQSEYGNNGFTDGLTELLAEDDAATANWGSEWQMPSYDQIRELINSSYITTEWTTQNGVNGYKITSKSNGNSIFLPAAGYRSGTFLYDVGSYGGYWSRSLNSSITTAACYLYFSSSGIGTSSDDYRYCGQGVRPVRKKN